MAGCRETGSRPAKYGERSASRAGEEGWRQVAASLRVANPALSHRRARSTPARSSTSAPETTYDLRRFSPDRLAGSRPIRPRGSVEEDEMAPPLLLDLDRLRAFELSTPGRRERL